MSKRADWYRVHAGCYRNRFRDARIVQITGGWWRVTVDEREIALCATLRHAKLRAQAAILGETWAEFTA